MFSLEMVSKASTTLKAPKETYSIMILTFVMVAMASGFMSKKLQLFFACRTYVWFCLYHAAIQSSYMRSSVLTALMRAGIFPVHSSLRARLKIISRSSAGSLSKLDFFLPFVASANRW